MAQHDYDIANQTFPTFRADLNAVLQAILSNNAGPTAPPVTATGMIWVDTDTSPPTWKIRNANNSAWDLFASISTPPGIITMLGGAAAPSGWLLCNGAEVSRATFAPLFAVIGTTYGAGNGSTTFNVPNLTQRFPMGAGVNPLGRAAGSFVTSDTALTVAQIPSHQHSGTTDTQGNHAHDINLGPRTGGGVAAGDTGTATTTFQSGFTGAHAHNFATSFVGGGQGHNHTFAPPYLAVNFIIKV